METVKLDDEQKEKVEEIVDNIEDIDHPLELVDQWEAMPDECLATSGTQEYRFVECDKIVGTAPQNLDRLEKKRLLNVLRMLYTGEFEKKHATPPNVAKCNDEYYVEADGTHRVLAHKALGMEKIWCEVSVRGEQ